MARARQQDGSPGAAAAADDLYGLPLDEFTAARNALAKRAKDLGDTSAAAAIGKLSKPNTVAWLANQLVRERRDDIESLLELGGAMRAATASLAAAELRTLSRQQRQLVHALVQHARRLAATAGRAVSDEVARGLEGTLHAALADDEAARQLAAGRLTIGLSSSGFPGLEVTVAPPSVPAPRQGTAPTRPSAPQRVTGARRPDTGQDARLRQVQQAKHDEAEARSAAKAADRAHAQARQALERATRGVHDTATDVDHAKAQLDAALQAQTDAKRRQREARAAADRADREAQRARRRLDEAQARRIGLQQ